MVYGNDYVGVPGYIEEYDTSTPEVFKAGFDEAISDNPFTKMLDYIEVETQTGGSLDLVSDQPPRLVSKQDAEKRARESGVVVRNIPEDGMNEGALSLLVERQYQKKVRREAIEAGGGGFVKNSAELMGGFAGSMVDPLNVAASFIPVVGQARYANWLNKAAGPVGRLGVRAGVGAAEGFVGSVLMEPASYALSQELGDDYTMANSLVNIGFGTALGGGLHAAGGALGDGIDFYKKNSNASKVSKQMDAASPETRMEYARTAVAQAAEDRRINVDPIREAHALDVQDKMSALDQKIAIAMAAKDEASVKALSSQRANLAEQLDPSSLSKADAEIKTAELVDSEIKNMMEEVKAAEVNTALVDTADGSKNRFYDNSYPEWYKEVGAKNKADFEKIIESKSGARYEKIKALAEERLTNGYESNVHGQVMPDGDFRQFKGLDPVPQSSRNLKSVSQGLKALGEDAPDSRFVDDNLVKGQTDEIASDKIVNGTSEEIKALMTEEMAILKEDADQMGIDLDDLPEIKSADELIKSVDEQSKMLRAMALCASRKG